MDSQSKVCTRCGVLKGRSEFYPKYEKDRPGRVTGKCRLCIISESKAWNLAHPKPKKPRKSATKVPERIMLRSARVRAKEQGVPFELTLDDIQIPLRCPVLGIPLIRGKGKLTGNSPSLDKIKPELGYIPGNVAVISMRANAIKQNASSAEILLVAQWVASMGC